MEFKKASKQDLKLVLSKLEEEDKLDVEGCFYCNRGVVERSQQTNDLHVLLDSNIGEIVGFMVTNRSDIDILEIFHKYRGNGYGKEFVEYYKKLAKEEDIPFIKIDCRPNTSIPFWKKMGFKMFINEFEGFNERNYGSHAFMLIDKRNDLPKDLKKVDVEIRFYPERKLYDENISPFEIHKPNACWVEEDLISLEERISFFYPSSVRQGNDLVIEIIIEGESIFLDKAKRDEGCELGINSYDNEAFYIDEIYHSET